MDAVFDTVGGDALKASANVLTPEGRLVSIADPDVFGYGGRYYFVRPDAEDLLRLTELAEQGVVSVHVSETFPLERAADAYRSNEEGRTRGKIVVAVAWDEESWRGFRRSAAPRTPPARPCTGPPPSRAGARAPPVPGSTRGH